MGIWITASRILALFGVVDIRVQVACFMDWVSWLIIVYIGVDVKMGISGVCGLLKFVWFGVWFR